MPSRRLELDRLDWKFLLARSGFLLLGTVATILLTVWVPALEELDSRWSPLLVMGITAAAEFINRWLKDSRGFLASLLLFAALGLAGCGHASAQIVVPDRVEPHSKIVATLEHEIPDGAEIKSSWSVPARVDYEQVGDRMLIWAPPGKHELGVSLIWVQFELLEIEVAGETRTIKNLLDFGQQTHKAAFTVAGKPPDPEPDEPDEPAPPDVPADPFDNLGQRVAHWARGLPNRNAAAAVYRSAAELLRSDPAKTQNDVAALVVGRKGVQHRFVRLGKHKTYSIHQISVGHLFRYWLGYSLAMVCGRRWPGIDHAVFWFTAMIVFSATVIFESGAVRWLSLIGFAILATFGTRSRRPLSDGGAEVR